MRGRPRRHLAHSAQQPLLCGRTHLPHLRCGSDIPFPLGYRLRRKGAHLPGHCLGLVRIGGGPAYSQAFCWSAWPTSGAKGDLDWVKPKSHHARLSTSPMPDELNTKPSTKGSSTDGHLRIPKNRAGPPCRDASWTRSSTGPGFPRFGPWASGSPAAPSK